MPSLDEEFLNCCQSSRSPLVTTALNDMASRLARSYDLRRQFGKGDSSVWLQLVACWRLTSEGDADNVSTSAHCLSLSKFTRNLVAGVPENQERAFENEPYIRHTLHNYTSWSATQDPSTFSLTRVLTQTLSNLVTANETLISQLWKKYMALPEDQLVLMRVLASPDPRTVMAAIILILNCTHGSPSRSTDLCATKAGVRLCVSFLDRMALLFQAHELSESEESNSDSTAAFDIGYDLFKRIIEANLTPTLYYRLSLEEEIITPSQVTALKLLDAYLNSQERGSTADATLCPLLANCFVFLSGFLRNQIELALDHNQGGNQGDSTLETTFNRSIPQVFEALVLVSQCVISLTVIYSDVADLRSSFTTGGRQIPEGSGLIEPLIETLRILDLFLPRVFAGKPMPVPQTTSTAQPSSSPSGSTAEYAYLKRDLVRLLGILCHRTRRIQDCVRTCGGIPVVMNLCVVDERNPYLREHAIYTLHNLLEENSDNQAVVDSIRPTRKGD